jgi:hypothetical protein
MGFGVRAMMSTDERMVVWRAGLLGLPLLVIIGWLWGSGITPASSDLAARHDEIVRTCSGLVAMPISAYVVNWATVVILGAAAVAAIAGLRVVLRTFGRLPDDHVSVAALEILLVAGIVAALLTTVVGLLSMPDFYQEAIPVKSICEG